MKQFYVFLDIDGVLNNHAWIKNFFYNKDSKHNRLLSLDNIAVLNKFFKTLKNKGFEVVLVISSSWRHHMQITISQLKENGLEYEGPFHRTNFEHDGVRGLQIKDFIKQHKIQKNFVVIDDETADISPHIDSTNIIKATGIFKLGLTEENTQSFIETNLPKIVEELKNNKLKENNM